MAGESRYAYAALADLLPHALFEADRGGNVTGSNRVGLEAFGLSAEDLERGLTVMDLVVPEDRPHAAELVARRLAGETPGPAELGALTRGGSTFPCLVLPGPIEREGEAVGLLWVVVDLTGRKQLEAELELRREEAIRASRAKDAFIAAVSHELRTPLVTGLGYVELLLEGRLGGKLTMTAEASMQVAQRNLRRLATLVDDLVGYAELSERGEGLVDAGRIDVAALLGRVARALEERTGRARGSVAVRCGAEPLYVEAQEAMIEAALANLVDNAHRHGGESATISLGAERCGADRVELTVADDGPGMADEVRARAFEPFYRGSRAGPGTGLGLAYVRRALAIHGAPVVLETEEGKGTVLSFSLRRAGPPSR